MGQETTAKLCLSTYRFQNKMFVNYSGDVIQGNKISLCISVVWGRLILYAFLLKHLQSDILSGSFQAASVKIHPLYVMLPGTLSASFAFMLPVATPPNAIVFSYGHIRVLDMVRCLVSYLKFSIAFVLKLLFFAECFQSNRKLLRAVTITLCPCLLQC